MFYYNFVTICKNNGTTVTKVVDELKMSHANLSAWKKGRTPNLSTIHKIAKHMGVEPALFVAEKRD